MPVQVGDLIQFKRDDAGDSAPWTFGVVVTHKRDEDYLNPNHDGKTRTVIRAISANFPSGAGKWITWGPDGNRVGLSDDPLGPGGAERVTFSGNFMIVRPGCGKDGSGTAVIYRLVNMSQPDKAV